MMETEKTLIITTYKGVRIEFLCPHSSFVLIEQTIKENKDAAIAYKGITIPVKDIFNYHLK